MTILRLSIAIISCLVAVSCHAADRPDGKNSVQRKLTCGDAELVATTDFVSLDEPDVIVWTGQSIVLTNSQSTILNKKLRLNGKLFKQPFYKKGPVLDSVVSSWGCIQPKSGRSYIYLLNTCTPSTLRPKCTSENSESESIFDAAGEKISPRSYKHLGIDEVLSTQLPLQGVVD